MLCQQLQTNLKQLKTLYPELLTLDRKLDSVGQADRQIKESVYLEYYHTKSQAEDQIKKIEKIVYYLLIEQAKEILGEGNVLGPNEIEKTFDIHLEKIPKIPFSQQELERAKTLGQMLVLRVDKTDDDSPLSLQAMVDIIQPRWDKEDKGRLLWTINNYKNWQKITGNDWRLKPPRAGWALVSKELLPESTNKSYAQQIEIIIAYLKNQVFSDQVMPQGYKAAFEEWEQVKQTDRNIQALLNNPNNSQYKWQETAKKLSELKITQLTRQSLQEVIYDLALYFDKNGICLLPYYSTWSNSLSSNDDLLCVGLFDADGAISTVWRPYGLENTLGVLLSRFL